MPIFSCLLKLRRAHELVRRGALRDGAGCGSLLQASLSKLGTAEMLNRVYGALSYDGAVMPPAICESLGLVAGASYAQGAAATKAQWSRISRFIVDEFRPVQNHPVGQMVG